MRSSFRGSRALTPRESRGKDGGDGVGGERACTPPETPTAPSARPCYRHRLTCLFLFLKAVYCLATSQRCCPPTRLRCCGSCRVSGAQNRSSAGTLQIILRVLFIQHLVISRFTLSGTVSLHYHRLTRTSHVLSEFSTTFGGCNARPRLLGSAANEGGGHNSKR